LVSLVLLGLQSSLKSLRIVFQTKIKSFYQESSFAFTGILFLLLISFMTATLSAPNNWDGHSYHLPRVMHWIQNQAIHHYPTEMEKQLIFPPWSEYALAHLHLMWGSDALSNLVQWFSYLSVIIVCSYLGSLLGLSKREQVFAGLFSATLPMALLQSVSVQNDLVTSLWSLVSIVYILRQIQSIHQGLLPHPGDLDNLFLGFSVGLAVLTKGTAPIYILPWMLWLLFVGIRSVQRKKIFISLGLVGLLALFINSGHFLRNFQLFGTPLSTPSGLALTNEQHSVQATISNLIKNLSLHIPLPGRFTGLSYWVVDMLHKPLGIDPLEPKLSFEGSTFAAPILSNSEHVAGNPIHFFLLMGSLFFILKFQNNKSGNLIVPYLFSLIGVGLLFCFLLKWQQYHSRLHLAMFLMASPLISFGLEEKMSRTRFWEPLLICFSFIPLFFSKNHPWLGNQSIFMNSKQTQYFYERPHLLSQFQDLADELSKNPCRNIGLTDADHETWEYPLWVMLKAKTPGVNLEYHQVKRKSGVLTQSEKNPPCVIVSLNTLRKVDPS